MVAKLDLPYRETIAGGHHTCASAPTSTESMFFKIKIILILFLWKTKYWQNLCGFQVGVAADGKSRGAKKGEEKENLGHGHSPDAHHHLSHAPWQGRPGAQQGSFLGDQGREEEERRQMGFASRIRPSLLTA